MHQDIIAKFRESISHNETIVLSCRCSITYTGRAESFLADGDRLVIIKSDGTLLVHQPSGSVPVNYMPKDSVHKMLLRNAELCLESKSSGSKETIRIVIHHPHFLYSQKLDDSQRIAIQGTERDMSDMIYENPELIEKGFKPLSREEHTKYGFIDVFGYDKSNVFVVVECKRYNADFKAVSQLKRYVDLIKKNKGLKEVRGIIASPKISDNALDFAKKLGFEYRSISPPKYLEEYDKKQKKLGEY